MCPACLANAAVMAGSVMSTGGVAALALKLVRVKKSGPADKSSSEEKTESEGSNDHANYDQQ